MTYLDKYANDRRWCARTKDKKPIAPRSGNLARSNDWATFDTKREAHSRAEQDDLPGIGIGLGKGLYALDLDGCVDPDTLQIEPHAVEIMKLVDSYNELTISGMGIKIFFECETQDEIKGWSHSPGPKSEVALLGFGRYSLLTEQAINAEGLIGEALDLVGSPKLRSVPYNVLNRVKHIASTRTKSSNTLNHRDSSRSAAVYRAARKAHDDGLTRAEFDEMMEEHDGEEGDWWRDPKTDDRQKDRVWERSRDPLTSLIEGMNSEFAHAMMGPYSRIIWFSDYGIEILKVKDFHELCQNRLVTIDGKTRQLSRVWLAHQDRRQYKRAIFAPNQTLPDDTLNLFQGFDLRPDPSGSCEKWLVHIRDVLCSGNETYSEYLLDYLADILQYPDRKPSVGIAIYSPHEGVGKDLAIEYFGKILGRYFNVIQDVRHLTGNFNAHLLETLLISLPETVWSGDRNDAGKLKTKLSETHGILEKKGVDSTKARFYFRVIATSNELWIVNIGEKDRRWFVLDVMTPPRSQSYFDDLVSEMNNGGPAALLDFLLKRDLTGFNARRAPITNAHVRVKMESLRGFPKWYAERLSEGKFNFSWENGSGWQCTIACATVRQDYESWHKSHKFQGECLDSRKFGKALKKWCPSVTRQKRGENGRRVYVFPELVDCRKAFESELGGIVDWDSEPRTEETI